ncbi:Mu transposase C-terminal domain-containing protein [Cerasicoccus fimbriatus]|uniref:Mu transposase C-terminal domain-containing protein n=1 Tax=Cerasicoccus fimbriatus TaxID=3014554 RepID=UPI0022B43D5F|nr:Mu transposase C-terminal domain-containing protein [Cerasicoccus sp. TK19100]
MTDAPQFTASQIAAALGRKRGAVYRELRQATPSSKVIVSGREADAWDVASLPEKHRRQLWEICDKRSFKSPETLLQHGTERWEPKLALSRIAPHHINKAQRTMAAFNEVLGLIDQRPWYDLRSLGLVEYKRVFGHSVSSKQWERIFERILERDGGRYEFNRLELYLDDNLSPKITVPKPSAFDAGLIRPALDLVEIKEKPTPRELQYIWAKSFEALDFLISQGKKPRRAKREIIDYLDGQEVCISKSRLSLEQQFRTKNKLWIEAGRISSALADARKGNSGAHRFPKLSEHTIGKLCSRALSCGGRIQQAWRELWDEGELPPAVYEFYASSNGDRVPAKVRKAVTHEVMRMQKWHQGPKKAKLDGPKLVRNWESMPSGCQFQSDDLTPPVYFWIEDETEKSGVRVTRGQFFPWIDTRSTFIIDFQLIPEKAYSSLDILRGIIRVHDVVGLPEEFYFERGIWEKSLLIKGRRDERGIQDTVYGLESIVRIKHALDPSAKVVERVLGSLQNYMERDRGYAGRNEREDCPEHIQRWIREVQTGKRDPSECFYHYEEWLTKLKEYCERYNQTPREGKQCQGKTPWETFMANLSPQHPLTKLRDEARHILSTHRREITINSQGATIAIGRQKFVYRGEATGRREGEKVLAWFDPENMDSIFISDLDNKNIEIVERAAEVSAFNASDEELAAASAQAKAHARHARIRYRDLTHQFPEEFHQRQYRKNWVDLATRETSEAMERLREESQKETRKKKRSQRTARKIGVRTTAAPGREDLHREGLAELENLGIPAADLDEL